MLLCVSNMQLIRLHVETFAMSKNEFLSESVASGFEFYTRQISCVSNDSVQAQFYGHSGNTFNYYGSIVVPC